jgi:hypothetical protein
LYASGGNDNWILQYAIIKDTLALKDSIKLGAKWPWRISPTGIEIDDAKKMMYVGTKENNSLYFIDLATKVLKDSINWKGKYMVVCFLRIKRDYMFLFGEMMK